MKCFITILSALALTVGAFASTKWDIRGELYNVDTLYHAQVGPGTMRTALSLSGKSVLKLHYTTTDLSNSNVGVKVVMGDNKLSSPCQLPQLPASSGDDRNIYVAGINADMFSYTGTGTIGNSVANSIVYKSYKGNGWFGMTVDKNNNVQIGSTSTFFSITGCPSAKAVNAARSDGEIIIYTAAKGGATGTSAGGVEVPVEFVDAKALLSYGSTKVRVSGEASSKGNMKIPENGLVLSGAGWVTSYLENLKLGDFLDITPTFNIDNKPVSDVVEMTGGCPVILKNGEIQDNDKLLDHLSSRQPRTAVGYSSDHSKLVMLVVDGRQQGVSEGVDSKTLASIMSNVGCVDALNLDGGGSSMLYVRDFGICNVPSEMPYRKVINGLFITTPVDNDNAVAQIRFEDHAKKLKIGESYSPVVYAYNSKGVLLNKDLRGFSLSVSHEDVVVENGKVKCNKNLTFALTANYNGMSATIPVTVGDESEPGASDAARLELLWINRDVASLHTSARQGFGKNDKFYLQNKDTRKIEVWGVNGKENEIESGAGTNITADDAGNIIVRVGAFNTDYVSTRQELRIIAPDGTKSAEFPLYGIASGRADFWGHVSGNVLDKSGGVLIMGTAGQSLVTEIPVKSGAQDCALTSSHPYVNPLGVSVQMTTTSIVSNWGEGSSRVIALLSPLDNVTNCNSIQKMRYDEYGSLVHDSYFITPYHNSCSGFSIFNVAGVDYIVYSSGTGKADGFSVARLATKETYESETSDNNFLEATKEPLKNESGKLYAGNSFYSNHFSVEPCDERSVYIYQYFPNGYIAKYLFSPAVSSVENVGGVQEYKIYTRPGGISITGEVHDVQVYNYWGNPVSSGQTEITLPPGVYIVIINGKANKLLIN